MWFKSLFRTQTDIQTSLQLCIRCDNLYLFTMTMIMMLKDDDCYDDRFVVMLVFIQFETLNVC